MVQRTKLLIYWRSIAEPEGRMVFHAVHSALLVGRRSLGKSTKSPLSHVGVGGCEGGRKMEDVAIVVSTPTIAVRR